MKKILTKLINNETLSKATAKEILVNISNAVYNPSQVASFMTIFMMRRITIEELAGFREAMLELCVKIDLDNDQLLDLCGTGGDGKDTFNISTLSTFVCAGAGYHVAKHSNYGVSSTCGSSNVMEHLGVKFSVDEGFLKHSLEQSGVAFLHAPLFHPSMKNVAPIRRELGVKTFFNMLGPLTNPVQTANQSTGVFSLELVRIYSYLLQKSTKNYSIIHSIDGYDEISLTGGTKIVRNDKEEILYPEDFGVSLLASEDIYGGDTVANSAKIFINILRGTGTQEQNNVVCANAAIGIATVSGVPIQKGFEQAKESLMSGKALNKLKALIKLSEEI